MRTLALHFSDKGKAALQEFFAFIKSHDSAKELIELWAFELAFIDDREAEAKLADASRTLMEAAKRANPELTDTFVNALTTSFCELVAARTNEFKSLKCRA